MGFRLHGIHSATLDRNTNICIFVHLEQMHDSIPLQTHNQWSKSTGVVAFKSFVMANDKGMRDERFFGSTELILILIMILIPWVRQSRM